MNSADERVSIGTLSESGIPIRNIWFLIAYASNVTTGLTNARTSSDPFLEDLPDLVARLLIEETRSRIWRSLTVGYRQRQNELTRLRGAISHIQTERRNSFARGRVVCAYQEITLDTPENRLVRTALRLLSTLVTDTEIKKTCKETEKHLDSLGVGLLPNRGGLVSRGRIPANPRDARMCALAILALQMEIPTQDSGTRSLYSPDINDVWLRSLFEKALLGFYQFHLSGRGWKVSGGRKLRWHTEASTSGLNSILPAMKSDIELTDQTKG